MSNSQKKTSSNVPGNASKVTPHNKSSPQKGPTGTGQNNGGGLLNAKHLYNFSQPRPYHRDNSSNTTFDENLLMKKLFEAVQKQKNRENDESFSASTSTNHLKRSKKTTNKNKTIPKTTFTNLILSSETYAGAAFDRAPAATSFPIPSFIKKGPDEFGEIALSSSCPLSNFDTFRAENKNKLGVEDTFVVEAKLEPFQAKSKLKSLSVNELFKIDSDPEINFGMSKCKTTTDKGAGNLIFGNYKREEELSIQSKSKSKSKSNNNNINSIITTSMSSNENTEKNREQLNNLTKDLRNFLNIK